MGTQEFEFKPEGEELELDTEKAKSPEQVELPEAAEEMSLESAQDSLAEMSKETVATAETQSEQFAADTQTELTGAAERTGGELQPEEQAEAGQLNQEAAAATETLKQEVAGATEEPKAEGAEAPTAESGEAVAPEKIEAKKEFNPDEAPLGELVDKMNEKFGEEAETKLRQQVDALIDSLDKMKDWAEAPAGIAGKVQEVFASLTSQRKELLGYGAALLEKAVAQPKDTPPDKRLAVSKAHGLVLEKMMDVNRLIFRVQGAAQKLRSARPAIPAEQLADAGEAQTADGSDIDNFFRIAEANAKDSGASSEDEVAEWSLNNLDRNMLGNMPGGYATASSLNESGIAALKKRYEAMKTKPALSRTADKLSTMIKTAEKFLHLNKRL